MCSIVQIKCCLVNETTLIPVRFVRPHMSHCLCCARIFFHTQSSAHGMTRTITTDATRARIVPGTIQPVARHRCGRSRVRSDQRKVHTKPPPLARGTPPSRPLAPLLVSLVVWLTRCVQEAERYFTKPRIFVVGNKSDEHSDMHIQSSAEIVVHCISLSHTPRV